ncbi:probable E3 ubiquitin-protein ligase ARI7 [Cicer arietinum]|uniref:RBR-type E3 ubiquitin transferase n=1 Tax=Cicer arietinum TaxID=3827 RepID=A0A1S2YJI1_CICAR|nr:probable E3 ubiquitin-protein ligase ARI7 [Cicer arietinum]
MEKEDQDLIELINSEDDKYSTNSTITKQHFSVLTESHIKHLQHSHINQILSILPISKPVASLLLSHYHWNVAQVLESWFSNHEKVLKTIGLSNQPKSELELGFHNSQIITCEICFETFFIDKIRSSWCGHPFCINCWKQYVDTNIDDKNCFNLRCPKPNCDAAVDEDMIHQLASESRKIKYDRFFFRSFVENNNDTDIKWCPNPGCGYAIRYELPDDHDFGSRINYDVTCLCDYSFCWDCEQEAHTPVDCETVAKWMEKSSSDYSELEIITSKGWIVANTKPCPNCKMPIEKNKGCRVMTCKCRFQFCWLCLYGLSSCRTTCRKGFNNIQGKVFQEKVGDKMQRIDEKTNLDRFMYYHQLWSSNEISRKNALQNLIDISTSSNQYIKRMSLSWKKPEKYFDFIKDAWKQVVECRRILKWGYVYVYNLPQDESAKVEFLDHIQGIAQVTLDKLHRLAENESRKFLQVGLEKELNDFRVNLITLTKVTKNHVMKLVKELENGLAVVPMKRRSSEIDNDSFKKQKTTRETQSNVMELT